MNGTKMRGTNYLPEIPKCLADSHDLEMLHREYIRLALDADAGLGIITNSDFKRAHVDNHLAKNPFGKAFFLREDGTALTDEDKQRIYKAIEIIIIDRFLKDLEADGSMHWQSKQLAFIIPLEALSKQVMGVPSNLPKGHPYYTSEDAGEAFNAIILGYQKNAATFSIKSCHLTAEETIPAAHAIAVFFSYKSAKFTENSSPYPHLDISTFFPVLDTQSAPSKLSEVLIIPDSQAEALINTASAIGVLASQVRALGIPFTEMAEKTNDIDRTLREASAAAKARITAINAKRNAATAQIRAQA